MSANDAEDELNWGERLLAISFLIAIVFGWNYFYSDSDEKQPSTALAPEKTAAPPTELTPVSPPKPKTEAPKLAALEPKKSQPVRVRADYEICSKVTSSSRNFLDQISVSIGVSPRNIEIIGGIYGGAGDRCKINIMTPLGAMECNSGYIYTDDGGDSYFTRGTEIGVNNSCY